MDSAVFARLDAATQRYDTVLCCGLDPDVSLFPECFRRAGDTSKAVHEFLSAVVDVTSPLVCAYKLQKAYFDLHLDGLRLLRDVVTMIRARAPHALVLLDAKVGDIEHTMDAYCRAYFDTIGVDVLVLNPYMGADVWKALVRYPGRAGAVIVRSSNDQASEVQDVQTSDGLPLWRHVLRLLLAERRSIPNLFPILSTGAVCQDGPPLRSDIPDEVPILVAGVGAQGGDLNTLRHLVNTSRRGILVNSSRGLLYPYATNDPRWEDAIRSATQILRERCNRECNA